MKKIIKQLLTPILQKHRMADLLFALIRIFCGLLLTLDFGSSKFGIPWTNSEQPLGFFEVAAWFPEDVASFGGVFAMAPVFFAWIGAFSEAVGGLLLALGLATRISGFLISCTMLVAIVMQQSDSGMYACLPALGFLWVALYNTYLGSGRYGIDYLISKTIKS